MKPKEPTPKTPEVCRGLDAIQQLVSSPITVKFKYQEKDCEIAVRLLIPKETEMLRLVLDGAIPKIVRGKKEEDDRIDYADPEYLKNKVRCEREARALAIFWGCQDFQKQFEKKAGSSVPDIYAAGVRPQIVSFVQGLLTDEVLELLYRAVTTAEISVKEHVNFS